jgi:hypothetical protein
MTEEQADVVLAANGIPPAKAPTPPKAPKERRALVGACWFGSLTAQAVIAVATPLLTAAVDGLGILIAGMTIWELWHPVEALADHFLAWWG